jgi:putative endonuclease
MLTADAKGRRAEAVAVWWFRLHGYRILVRRFATPVGEIDLVVRRGELLAFVEVKRRPTADAALAALTPRQQARIARAAEWFLKGRPWLAHLPCRFDVLALTPWRWPSHVPDAWRL